MEALLLLLRLSNQDSSGPCRIITAVTSRAASAAADLLSSGDYALAYRQARFSTTAYAAPRLSRCHR